MTEFSGYFGEKSGKSCSIDLDALQEKIGGNMPIVANALGNLGCETICVGAMGYPEPEQIFTAMNSNCKLLSVTNPGYCYALEFGDSKLMLATNTHLDHLNYQKITECVPEASLIEYFDQCDAIAFLNWGELINSNDIWGNILRRIIPKCKFNGRKLMLIDFSDFSKRGSNEVEKMLELLEGYSENFDITISVNGNELGLLLEKLQLGNYRDMSDEQLVMLAERLKSKNFVIHLLDTTKYVKNSNVYSLEKEVIKDPKIITGGGDNFNAGLLFGLLLGLDIENAIRIGSGLSCLYVEGADNLNFQKLKSYFDQRRDAL
jgi:sugar/nucleoside kinase (ribokinase family)